MKNDLIFRAAYEDGADIDISLHLKTREEAEAKIQEYARYIGRDYIEDGYGNSNWFEVESHDTDLMTVVAHYQRSAADG